MRFPIVLSLLTISFATISCDPEPSPEFVRIIFEIPLTISPERDTIAIGDTLWLTASFPDSILDITTQKRYRVTPKDFDFKTGVGLRNLIDPTVPISSQPGFTAGFSILNKIGSISNQSKTFSDLNFLHTKEVYQARIGFVAKQSGVSSIYIFSSALSLYAGDPEPDLSFIKLPPTSDGRKRQPVYATTRYTINDGRTHFDLFQQNCKPISLTIPSEDNIYFEQKGTYTFVVK